MPPRIAREFKLIMINFLKISEPYKLLQNDYWTEWSYQTQDGFAFYYFTSKFACFVIGLLIFKFNFACFVIGLVNFKFLTCFHGLVTDFPWLLFFLS